RLAARRARLRSFARALHRAYPVRDGWRHWLHDDTLICRCEEVPAARVLEAARELGATDPRTVKLLSRAGMGWCQGRMCGHATACLSGDGAPGEPALRALARRPFAQPVRLGDLAEIVAEESPHE
ncbi:(2Fe-2S)-binding protein, partial [Actinocorallia lasiicapitis]